MGQRKKRFVALVCAVSVIALSGCGDDLTQQVCIPGVEELAQPIGGYHTGPQDDQPGDNIGEIVLPGGKGGDNTALPESGQSGASDTLMGGTLHDHDLRGRGCNFGQSSGTGLQLFIPSGIRSGGG